MSEPATRALLKNHVNQGPYIALDFETSAPRGPCACAIGMARIEDFEVVDTYYALIRPPSSRIFYTKIHGLAWKDLRDQPTFAQLWPEINAFIRGARFFIAHNASFDRGVLYACCMAANIPVPKLPFLCTVRGARQILNLRRNDLASVCAHLQIPLDHHHAASDALACGLAHMAMRRMGLSDEGIKLKPLAARAFPEPPANRGQDE